MPTGVYLQDSGPVQSARYRPGIATALLPSRWPWPPTTGSDIDLTYFDYLTGGFPWFATPQGYLHLWEFKATPDSPHALWIQWAPLP